MKAADVMNPNPSVLKATDTIGCGADIIMQNRYRSLPVVDDNYCYLGMFGVNCLLRQVLPKAVLMHQGVENIGFIHESLEDLYQRFDESRDKCIEVCMSHDIKPVAPDTPLMETLLQLYETKSSIPVVEPGTCKLMGMVSYFDVGHNIMTAGAHRNA